SIVIVFFVLLFVFFFSSRRRHTRSKRDWSSDVCSSDLGDPFLRYRRSNGTNPWEGASGCLPPPLTRPRGSGVFLSSLRPAEGVRSEERRVGKECRYRMSTYHEKKKNMKNGKYRETTTSQ